MIWIPFTQVCNMPIVVEISPVILEENIFEFCQFIFPQCLLSPLEKKVGLILWTNLSAHPKDALCQVWLKLAQWFCKRRAGPLFEQTSIPSTQGCFVPSLVENGPVVLENKLKLWKVYRQTHRQTDDTKKAIRKAHFSFQLAQVS